MKQRLSSLDVRAIAHELQQSLVTLRLSNIYDLSSKIFLLRFAKPDVKKQLLIDSGFRCHLTEFSRPTAPAPSQFVARVRKFLRTRRCTAVSQIGTDRVIELQFSDGSLRLFFEFFASGNIILTDADLKILALLRNVKEGEGQEPQRVGLTYSLDNRLNFGGVPAFTEERLRDALETTVKRAAAAGAAPKKSKKAGGDLRSGLATTISELPPILVDHAFRENNFDPKAKVADILEDEGVFDALFKALERARSIIDDITSSDTVKGYIVAKNPDPGDARAAAECAVVKPFSPESSKGLLYEDFSPFLPKQFADDPSNVVLTFEGFNQTVDEFFSSLEGQKLESRLTEREAAAKRKLDATKREHEKRIEDLQEDQLLNLRKAAAIEANVERVQEAMDAVIGLLEQGMDWVDVGKLVEREQRRNNPVAEIIKLPMDLANNTITLVIAEQDDVEDDEMDNGYETEPSVSDDDDDDDERGVPVQPGKVKTLEVDIKLNLTPWSNAGEYYDQKRSAAVKQEKTVQQSSIALKSAQEKIAKDLQKGLKKEKPAMQLLRRQMWFEKFHWFISSDGYLVLGGRDAQQNEILYRRYLKRGDIYVHADLHGAPSVIIKNNPRTPDAPVPPSTLSQAGRLAVCASSAWDSKAGMGAYWVGADQVSKSAPTGEFLQTGSFMVRGKRNELPPAPLVIGFGVMFRVSDESKAKHTRHRVYDAVEAEPSTATKSAPEAAEEEVTDDIRPQDAVGEDDGSDSEPEDEDDGADSTRANPLQSGAGDDEDAGGNGDGEEVVPPTRHMAQLQISAEPETKEAGAFESQAGDGDDSDVEEKGDQSEDEGAGSVLDTPATPVAPSAQPRKGPLKRGQRGKAKKMAAKYKHQDDEDRAAAEALLGAAAGRLKREAEAKAKAEEEAALAAARERRKEQLRRQQQATAAHEEARRQQMEDAGGDGDGDVDCDNGGGGGGGPTELSALDSLVGTPQAGDEILEAIPVCAPYAAMARIKYKAKMQPGLQKKGKAIREDLGRLDLARVTQRREKAGLGLKDVHQGHQPMVYSILMAGSPQPVGVAVVVGVAVLLGLGLSSLEVGNLWNSRATGLRGDDDGDVGEPPQPPLLLLLLLQVEPWRSHMVVRGHDVRSSVMWAHTVWTRLVTRQPEVQTDNDLFLSS
ncbi:serologically defined colon cancer antigen 1 [Magnaporthiopsis poae ATCC 64411]|uniref:Ribosome quality control complex subunit 2 n=1 Tax=Magnaporthiopsis poae (strain ATCC 64411 / 73-15) TaxID=644358 RepID=A0A0C4DR78_MAGP6|nr:serologically defined colon cancer antigen 1 [Magnaporthiopsis poae ATCC 64411]